MPQAAARERRQLADIYRSNEACSQVYLDVSVDTSDPPHVVEERRKAVIDRLRRDGAPEADIDAIVDVMATDETLPSPACQFILARNGEILVDEWIAGLAVEPETISFGPLPDLTPLLKSQPADVAYLVVETSRDGGEVRLYHAGSAQAEADEHVEGRTDMLHKAQVGGWRQDKNQDHVEEIWRQTQSQLASTVDELVRTRQPRLLVVAGDIRARQLLADELSEQSRSILSIEPTNTRAEGSSDEALHEHIEAELARVLAEQKLDVIDRIQMHEGRGDNLVELRFGAIVDALAAAQVDTLVLDSDALRDRTALALDAEPWIATAPESALGAQVIGTVPAQLALVRAALLTDAVLMFTDSITVPDSEDAVTLPDEAAVAALLRWQVGPPVPGTQEELT